jgi:methanogenic corrinoid protein MtbC1
MVADRPRFHRHATLGEGEKYEWVISSQALSKLNIQKFAQLMLQDRQSKPMLEFCQNTLAPLMISVGEAWAKNEIEVFHEHICTAFAERLLAAEILRFPPTEGNPTFLFALPPKEKHILGLLMAESVISETGANVCNLGADVPLTTIKNAALAINADVVCVSFSFSYPSREVVPVLRRLRSLLPASVQLWAGGSGICKKDHWREGFPQGSHSSDQAAGRN